MRVSSCSAKKATAKTLPVGFNMGMMMPMSADDARKRVRELAQAKRGAEKRTLCGLCSTSGASVVSDCMARVLIDKVIFQKFKPNLPLSVCTSANRACVGYLT